MSQKFRISLVKMIYAKIPKRDTPEPFLEIRAFVFLDKLPTGILLANLKRSLESAIREIMDKLLPHIFYLREGEYRFEEQTSKTAISVKQLTRFFKVEIDGMEVEPIDIDEIFTERLKWDKIPVDHILFKRERISRVLIGKEKLRLITHRIYRYMAFYREDGSINKDYDEGDISNMLKRIYAIEKRMRVLKKMLSETTGLFEKTTIELEKAIADLEKFSKMFKI